MTNHELGQVLSEWLEAQPLVRQVHSAPAPGGGKVGLLTVILEEPAAAPHFFDALNVAKASIRLGTFPALAESGRKFRT